MASFRLSALLLAYFLTGSFAANCSIPPVYNDIHKRVVHGSSIFQYGSFMGVGTPSQNQSVWISLRQNETSFASSDFCLNSTLTNCSASTGGNVDYTASNTWTQNNNYQSKDFSNNGLEIVHGTDNLNLFTHFFESDPATLTLSPNTPVEFALKGNVDPGRLGMGSSSTLLQRLVQVGKIAGRTFSLYTGSGMDRAGGVVNGSSVFGGYDAGRFFPPVYSQAMDLSNPDYLGVTVEDVILQDSTNPQLANNVSIMDQGQTFDARISTEQWPMKFPYQVTQNFASLLQGEASGLDDKSLRLRKPFNGTMTIKLSNGFQVTLPKEVVYNVSGISPVQSRDKSDNGQNYLSLAWLSEVYLMMDFETSHFHLAQVKAKNAFVMPQTFCPSTVPVPYDYSKPSSPFLRNGMIGAVIGGVIGGSALVIACLAIFFYWRRQKMAKDQEKRWAAEERAWRGQKNVETAALTPKKKMGFHWRPKITKLDRSESFDSVDLQK